MPPPASICARVADFLANQRKVTRVLYPFRSDHPQHNLARAELGVTSGLMRLSVGLEDASDLCEDLEQALKAA